MSAEIKIAQKFDCALGEDDIDPKHLLSLVPCGIFSVDGERRITSWNRVAEQITGYQAEEVLGHPCTLFGQEPCSERCTLFDDTTPKPLLGQECCIRRKDGETRIISKSMDVLFDQQGKIVGGIESFIDITDKISTREKLRESESRFRQVFENSLDGIVYCDMAGHFLECNPAYERMLGYTAGELSQLDFMQITPDEWHAFENKIIQQKIIGQGCSGLYQKEYIHKDGTVFPVELSVYLIRGDAGHPLGMFGVVRDISQRMTLEKELKQHQLCLEQLVEERTQDLWNEMGERSKTEEVLRFANYALDHAADAAFWLKAGDAQFIYVNDKACTVLGYTQEELLKMGPADIDADYQTGNAEERQTNLKQTGCSRLESRLRTRDGTLIPVEISSYYMEYEGNGYHINFARDTTRRKQVEEEIAIFQRFAEASQQGFGMGNMDFYLTYTNPALARILGFPSPDQAKRTFIPDYYLESDKARLTQEILPLVLEQGQCTVEMPLVSIQEKVTPTIQNIFVICDDEKKPICFANVIADITERKETESKLKAAQKELVETAHRAGMADVASAVLHNVGNVLNSINVTTELIQGKISNSKLSKLRQLSDLLQTHANDLGAFVSEDPRGQHVLVYLNELNRILVKEQSDIQAKLLRLTKHVQHVINVVSTQQAYARVSGVEEQLILNEVVEDAIQVTEAALDRHAIRVVREFGELLLARSNKNRLIQILVNLMSNGKYALVESGKADRVLTIRLYRCGVDRCRIEVEDNGTGIAPENLPKIFRHGFTTKKHGHGFGLHSSALAAKELGGSLTVHSGGVDQGATFCLELPTNNSTKVN